MIRISTARFALPLAIAFGLGVPFDALGSQCKRHVEMDRDLRNSLCTQTDELRASLTELGGLGGQGNSLPVRTLELLNGLAGSSSGEGEKNGYASRLQALWSQDPSFVAELAVSVERNYPHLEWLRKSLSAYGDVGVDSKASAGALVAMLKARREALVQLRTLLIVESVKETALRDWCNQTARRHSAELTERAKKVEEVISCAQ